MKNEFVDNLPRTLVVFRFSETGIRWHEEERTKRNQAEQDVPGCVSRKRRTP